MPNERTNNKKKITFQINESSFFLGFFFCCYTINTFYAYKKYATRISSHNIYTPTYYNAASQIIEVACKFQSFKLSFNLSFGISMVYKAFRTLTVWAVYFHRSSSNWSASMLNFFGLVNFRLKTEVVFSFFFISREFTLEMNFVWFNEKAMMDYGQSRLKNCLYLTDVWLRKSSKCSTEN